MRKVRKINVTTMVNPETFEKLTEISRQTGKSISALIRTAVEEWLEPEMKMTRLPRRDGKQGNSKTVSL